MSDLACVHCGSTDNFWAWYDQPERQTIDLVTVDANGYVHYDYSGIVKSGDEAGSDTSFLCGSCGHVSESLELLVGLPETPHVSTLAELFREGQRIPELDTDDFAELTEIVAEDEKRRRGTDGIADCDALNELAAYLRDNAQWNGGDFCELAATAIARTGRTL